LRANKIKKMAAGERPYDTLCRLTVPEVTKNITMSILRSFNRQMREIPTIVGTDFDREKIFLEWNEDGKGPYTLAVHERYVSFVTDRSDVTSFSMDVSAADASWLVDLMTRLEVTRPECKTFSMPTPPTPPPKEKCCRGCKIWYRDHPPPPPKTDDDDKTPDVFG
jgi:hypothetical protein